MSLKIVRKLRRTNKQTNKQTKKKYIFNAIVGQCDHFIVGIDSSHIA